MYIFKNFLVHNLFFKIITSTIISITTVFFINITVMRWRCLVSLISNIKPSLIALSTWFAISRSQCWDSMLLCVDIIFSGLCETCPMAMMFGHMHPVSLSSLSCISCPTGSAVHMLPYTWSQSWDHMALMMVCCNRIRSLLTHN